MGMVTITASILTCNELEPLKRCLASIKGHVDAYNIGVDDKTTDGTVQWLTDNGYNHYVFKFENFSQARNLNIEQIKTPWYLTIDSDELMLPGDAARLREVALAGDVRGIDAWTMWRLHWFDLEMQREWIPNKDGVAQFRLMRKHVRYSGKVHEQCVEWKRREMCDLKIQHFNMFYRDAAAWPLGGWC